MNQRWHKADVGKCDEWQGLLSQNSLDGFGFAGNDFQQYPCVTVRLTTFLLPVLQSPNIETETKEKFRLRQTQTLPDCFDINFIRDMSDKTLSCLNTCIRERTFNRLCDSSGWNA